MLLTVAMIITTLTGCWFIYQMLLQQGRLLIRIESLENELRASGIGPQPGPIGSRGGLPRDSVLPDFRLPLLGGGTASLSAYRGYKVLLIFFNPRCCYSMRLAPDLQQLAAGKRNLVPVIVTTGDPLDNERLFAKFPIGSSVLLQEGSEMATLYRVKGTPMGYLIDEDGRTASDLLIGPEILRPMLRMV